MIDFKQNRLHIITAVISLFPTSLLFVGCSTTSGRVTEDAYTGVSEQARRPEEAARLTREANLHVDDDPERAERLLREALAADLYHGPAHNNLGVIFLERGDLYAAANEFEWARKLMPGHPDPRVNLALTLERAGRVDDAIDHYESALEVYPGHIPSTQGLLRLQIRHDRTDSGTIRMLEEIAISGETEEWREWAKRELSLLRDVN